MIGTIKTSKKDESGRRVPIEFQSEIVCRFIHNTPGKDFNYGFFESQGRYIKVRERNGKWNPILRKPVNKENILKEINENHEKWRWVEDGDILVDDPWLYFLMQAETE